MFFFDNYDRTLLACLRRVRRTSGPQIKEAAKAMYAVMAGGGLVHAWGSGHSSMYARELFYRSGGLAPISPIYDYNTTGPFCRSSTIVKLDQDESYAGAIIAQHEVRSGEAIIVFSTPGVSSLSVEMCRRMKALGLKVIVVCGVEYAQGLQARHSTGLKLPDVGDIVIDMHVNHGDIALTDPEGVSAGALGTMVAMYIAQKLLMATIDEFIANDLPPPMVKAAVLPGAADHNERVYANIRGRLRFL